MADKRRQQAVLARLQRVRTIERRAALVAYAEAQSTHARLSGLAERSHLLARDYAGQRAKGEASALQALLLMRAQLVGIAREAQRMEQDASHEADAAGHRFAAADHRLELVEQHLLAGAQRAPLANADGLARRLQSTGVSPRGR